jgi:hypothetical protein
MNEIPDDPPPARRRHPVIEFWKLIGGGSLTLSILLHAGIFIIAGLVIFTSTLTEKNVDFLPGGGTKQGAEASNDLKQRVETKKRKQLNKMMPMKRVVSTAAAAITLPDTPPDLIAVPDMSSILGGGMKMSGGFGKGGAGGGFGSGIGVGGLSGVTFKPLMMFGMEMKDTRKIAVVMDVSRSMTRYLPLVAGELDKIARQSVLVLYFGCGIMPAKGEVEDKVRKTTGDEFASFWQHWQGKTPLNMKPEERRKLKYDPNAPMPLPDIYKKMAGRPNTWFIDFNGITYTWIALMSREVMEADTIYWFSDFMDRVDPDQMEIVRKKLKSRKQKLYIHASTRGRSFDQVVEALVKPLGGEVIETKVK